jgi:putative glutamine amidotransferase
MVLLKDANLSLEEVVRVGVTFNTFGITSRVEPYEAALREAGLEPVRNPDALDGLAGLLLSGGSDVNPKHYGHQRLRNSDSPDDRRDELEMALLRDAIDAGLPVFGICRGLQLFNVVFGGTLIQHLPNSNVHRQKVNGAEHGRHPAAHRVHVKASTRLAEIIGPGDHDVNSRHHQAVDRLGSSLVVSAIAEDGVVEGLELRDATFAIAVQWHPEDRIAVSEADRKLFDAFAAACHVEGLTSRRIAAQPGPKRPSP